MSKRKTLFNELVKRRKLKKPSIKHTITESELEQRANAILARQINRRPAGFKAHKKKSKKSKTSSSSSKKSSSTRPRRRPSKRLGKKEREVLTFIGKKPRTLLQQNVAERMLKRHAKEIPKLKVTDIERMIKPQFKVISKLTSSRNRKKALKKKGKKKTKKKTKKGRGSMMEDVRYTRKNPNRIEGLKMGGANPLYYQIEDVPLIQFEKMLAKTISHMNPYQLNDASEAILLSYPRTKRGGGIKERIFQKIANEYRKRNCNGKARPLKEGEYHPLCANFCGKKKKNATV